ncbi:MAG: ribosome biogenesis GTPase YqeH [Bacilli bacterium]|nr:ribosome biogenesis GTPase YqeH [Bacilli bacterium]
MSKCIGCGIKIQSTDKEAPGYVPVSATVDRGEAVYCKRCYDVIHHNKDYSSATYELFNDSKLLVNVINDYYQKLSKLKGEKALILLLIDVLDIYSGFIPKLSEYIGDNPVMILVNKTDVMPKSIKLNTLGEKIKQIGLNDNLNVRDVFFISALKQKNIDDIIRRVMDYFNRTYFRGNKTYLLGSTSVGKSTFVNSLLKKYKMIDNDLITTSYQHQTTLDFIPISIGTNNKKEECFLVDTPGYLNLMTATTYLGLESLKQVVPRTFIKSRSYQLKENQTMFLGGLVTLDFEGDVNVSYFVSNDLYIHRTKTSNKEELLTKSMYKLLVPPVDETELKRFGEFTSKTYTLSCDEEFKHWDLCIAGIGYVHLTGENFKVTVTLPRTILTTLVPNLL